MARSASKSRRKKSIEPKRNVVAPEVTPSNSASHSLNCILVGGQLLGKRSEAVPDSQNNIASWGTFEPIITPEVIFDQRKKPERYILLPHSRYITVLAYKTGVKVGTLVPSSKNDKDDKNVIIECVNLVKYQRKVSETTVQDVLDRMDVEDDDEGDGILGSTNVVDENLVMVGCKDGSVREFSLQVLGNHQGNTAKQVNLGPYSISGPCFRPRRVIRVLKKDPIVHMTVPHLRTPQIRKDGIVVYVAARRLDRKEEGEKESSKSTRLKSHNKDASFTIEVIRVLLPHFDGSTTDLRVSSSADSMRSLDKFKCKISANKKKKFANTLPFRMVSAAKALPGANTNNTTEENCSIFVVLTRANSISVYYDQLNSSEAFPPMSISMPSNNPLTVASISLNKADITCGHYRGNIRVFNNILNDIELYQIAMKKAKQLAGELPTSASKTTTWPIDPRKNLITSRVHWHALPVTSIVYDSMSYPMDPLLYSGGDESVLVTWQISQGRDRPVHVHPRLALGGIVHLSSSDRCDDNPASGILVYCEDNTLQLLESHNKGCLWKVQGLACGHNCNIGRSLQVDPRSDGQKNSQLVLTGLNQAPGYIHWFDPTRERLASSLEVVPFNRISKTEPDERPLPKPAITGHVFSKNGEDLITIDESQTENIYVGALEEPMKGDEYGTVSTIRFWSWNYSSSTKGESAPPYNEIASMTYPHGPKNRISAIDMSKDGTFACTVSCHEKAFRVWQKTNGSDKSISWSCRYKVKIPAGFSNCSTRANGLTFSDDNSLLVIAFGTSGTIWDTNGARLLTTFDHSQGNSCIECVQFISPGLHQDLLLIQSKACVSLRSPYGPYGSSRSFKGWSWSVPQSQRGYVITAVESIESRGCIAIAIYSAVEDQSRVIFVDIHTGKGGVGGRESLLSMVENINGCISALCAVGKQRVKSNWDNTTRKGTKSPLTLYALNSVGDLMLLTEDRLNYQSTVTPNESFVSTGPRLEITPNENNRRKRQRSNNFSVATSLSEELLQPKKLALDVFGFGTSNDSGFIPSTAELPSLSANFVKTFVGRNLRKSRA
mmetsp:Transcript_21734/g.45730  ORF Transcript_21734/g.45730 Transcript_21734/m.45730 type:complete len:1061 (-) Transcript_21734:41-3223(-)